MHIAIDELFKMLTQKAAAVGERRLILKIGVEVQDL